VALVACGRVDFDPRPPDAAPIECVGGTRNFIGENGHCYRYYNDASNGTWSDAVAACAADGGHLVTFTDEIEELPVVQALSPDGRPWIGGDDMATEMTWEWMTGEPFAYTRWKLGEPNDSAPGEDCAVLGDPALCACNYEWNDLVCSYLQPRVCETE